MFEIDYWCGSILIEKAATSYSRSFHLLIPITGITLEPGRYLPPRVP